MSCTWVSERDVSGAKSTRSLSTLLFSPPDDSIQRLTFTLRTSALEMVGPYKIYLDKSGLTALPARRLLDLYRPKMPCFNDDVQGTGCVTLAAIIAALHVTEQKLSDLRLVVFGAGSAGVGIADQVRDAIATEGNISHEEASKQIW